MIASVSGEVLVRRPDHVVIDTDGVGYRLAVSAETLKSVPAHGKRASLHAHLVAREDSLSLYGFASEEERDLFLHLISVGGVGPKVAMAALSGGPVRELLRAIAAGDAKRFQADADAPGPAGEEDPRTLVREGLLNLGYSPQEAAKLLSAAEGESPEEIVQSALRSAAGAKAA